MAPRAAARPMPRPVGWLLTASIAVLFTVSGSMLWLIGYNYEGLLGSGATKIHPGTYLTLLTFALAALASGNPVRSVAEIAGRHPAALFLLAVAILVAGQIVYRAGPGLAGTIDSYMLPVFVATLVLEADSDKRHRLETALHAAMMANALIGLTELATHQLFFPYRFDGEIAVNDARSTALQGHPLANAIVTAVYVLSLLSGGGRMATPVRAAAVVLQLMALVAFGGRSAIVTTALLGGALGLVGAFRSLRSGRIPLLAAAATVFALTAAPLAIGGLALGGFFDALLERFASDGGSAYARVEMLALLERIPFNDLMIGPDLGWVDSLRRTNGLELGIENPIVRTVLYQGIVVAALLTLAVGVFLSGLARASRRGALMPTLAFLLIANTFESISTKSTLLAKFAVIILVLFRPDRPRARIGTAVEPTTAPRRPGAVSAPQPRAAFEALRPPCSLPEAR